MRAKFAGFVTDINRLGPVVIVALTTLVCLPSLSSFVSHHLTVTSMLERYCVAFVLTTVGIRLLQRLVLRYALQNVTRIEQIDSNTSVAPSPEETHR